MIDITR